MSPHSETERRRFGYYIPRPNGTVDFVVHFDTVSREMQDELHEVTRVIYDVQPILMAFEVVHRNHCDLVACAEAGRERMNNSPNNMVEVSTLMDALVSAIQRLNNFISSATAFLAQTEAHLRSIHGKEAPQVATWTKARRDAHAASFAYRFLYELRNFAQHSSLPLSGLDIDAKREHRHDRLDFRAVLSMYRDGLLSTGYDWNRNVLQEIRDQPEKFDVLPLASAYAHDLRKLCLIAILFQSDRLMRCAGYLDVVKRKIQFEPGALPVVVVGETVSSDLPPSKYEVIPTPQFEWIATNLATHQALAARGE